MSEIFVLDDQHPEDNAMLQALYSRSPQSVVKQLEKVREVGSGNFMDSFYVGYGHQSIGDCGTTTLYIENVSMLTAKAIQDYPLYNGQEASTRYIDFSQQAIANPLGTEEGRQIQETWMAFYNKNMWPMLNHLEALYPIKEGESPKAYNKAIKSRAFDILRSFLPAGSSTYVSWHTTLRQAADHLMTLRHYPLQEVRDVATATLEKLKEKYRHSFNQSRYPETEKYLALASDTHFYDPADSPLETVCEPNLLAGPWYNLPEFKLRPPMTRLPHRFDALGQVTYEFQLDFGSFRDVQRHRNGVCRMPLLRTRFGFNQWYLDQMPAAMREEAEHTIDLQIRRIAALGAQAEDKQHYIAMGFNVPCKLTRGLPGTIYLIELRTGMMTHPTLRKVAQDMATTLLAYYPELKLHADMNPDSWSIRRGTQDIEQR